MIVHQLNSTKLSDIAAELPHDKEPTPYAQACPALFKCPSRDEFHDEVTLFRYFVVNVASRSGCRD